VSISSDENPPYLIVERFSGAEIFRVQTATWRFSKNDSGAIFALDIDCQGAVSLSDELSHVGDSCVWELFHSDVNLTESMLSTGFEIELSGEEDADGEPTTEFCYTEHQSSLNNNITIHQRDGDRLLLEVTGVVMDLNYYDFTAISLALRFRVNEALGQIMAHRSTLKNIIIDSWCQCIESHYSMQRINSERSLQASLWTHLDANLPKTRRMFIEPGVHIEKHDGSKRVYPDLAICNTKEVIAIIELKYQPRAQPTYRKDIASLNMLSRYRKKLRLSNTRFRGTESDAREYSFSSNMLFVWAGIHGKLKQPQEYQYRRGMRYLGKGYVELHAETSHDAPPCIYEQKP